MLGPASEHVPVLSSLLDSVSNGNVRLGVDRAGTRHLFVAVESGDRRVPDDVVGALLVKRRTFTFDGAAALFLDIQCIRSDLFDLFDDLLIDILDAMAERAGSDTALEVIDRWRSLLATKGRQALTQSAQRGLIAELHVLRLLWAPPSLIDVSVWRGPLGEPHDILAPTFAIEVKSVSSRGRSVEIHGPMQLAPPGRPLALVILELEEDEAGETVAHVAADIVQRSQDRDLANARLALAGYSSGDAELYSTRFAVRGLRHVAVDVNTPRIVPDSFTAGVLPEGLLYLSYALDLVVLERMSMFGENSLRHWTATCERHHD